MMPLPLPNLQVLEPAENALLGAVLAKPDVGPVIDDAWFWRALLADRVGWMMDHAESLDPMVEAFDSLGFEPTRDRMEILSIIRSPEFGQVLEALGAYPPLRRPLDLAAGLVRLQETPLEEWAAMLRATT